MHISTACSLENTMLSFADGFYKFSVICQKGLLSVSNADLLNEIQVHILCIYSRKAEKSTSKTFNTWVCPDIKSCKFMKSIFRADIWFVYADVCNFKTACVDLSICFAAVTGCFDANWMLDVHLLLN